MKIHTIELPEWLSTLEFISGREGDDDQGAAGGSSNDSTDDSSAGNAGSSSGNPDGSQSSDDDSIDHDDDIDKTDDRAELKEAIRKERRANKEKERRLRKLEREAQERKEAEQGELEAEKAKRERAEARAAKLAEGYLKTALDRAIEEAARKEGFVDVNDALAGVNRSNLVYEQDDEDPSDIDLDQKSVVKEVKALAAKKPHWVKQGTDDGGPSGSTFGGAGRRKGKPTNEDDLRTRYPALNY